jgi:hypothetical protein
MIRPPGQLTWGVGLGALLLAGCSLPSRTADAAGKPAAPGPAVEVAAISPDYPVYPPAARALAPPPLVSDYHPRQSLPPPPIRGPLERVRLEVKPAPPVAAAPPPIVEATPAEPKPPPDPPLVAAMRRLLQNPNAEPMECLKNYKESDRDQLLALLCRLAAGIGEGDLDRVPPENLAAQLDRLHGLIVALRRRAPLALSNVCFCRRIDGFGRYDALPGAPAFQAGVEGRPGERVQLYAEVRNFNCQPRGAYCEIRLASTLEIYDERGRVPVVTLAPLTCTDRSRTPRQDYFLNFQFHVPPRVPPGAYRLRVTVKDVTPPADGGAVSPRQACEELYFQVAAPAARPEAD